MPLVDPQTLIKKLLASGTTIDEINAVRKHVSAQKRGPLAGAVAPAATVGLLYGDVVGDDPSVDASDPLAPDHTMLTDGLSVLDTYDVDAPVSVWEDL